MAGIRKTLNDFHEDVPENFWLDEEFVHVSLEWI